MPSDLIRGAGHDNRELVFDEAGSGQARRDFGDSGFGTFLVVN